MAVKIMIDPGHGGYDNGATYENRREKDDTLNLSLAVGEILQGLGYDVEYTRTTDVYDSPVQKARIGNESGADFFVSIHRNSSPYPNQYNGVQTLIYDDSGIKADMARNVDSKLEEVGYQNLDISVRPNLAVLRRTSMPAILVEAGFINSDIDNQLFDNNFYETALAIAEGVDETIKDYGIVSMSAVKYNMVASNGDEAVVPPGTGNGNGAVVPPGTSNGNGAIVPPGTSNGNGAVVPPGTRNGNGVVVPPGTRNGNGAVVPPGTRNGNGVVVPPGIRNGNGVVIPPGTSNGNGTVVPTDDRNYSNNVVLPDDELERLEEEEPDSREGYQILTGIFRSYPSAMYQTNLLINSGIEAAIYEDDGLYQVRTGLYPSIDEAIIAQRELRNKGYSTIIVSAF